MNICLSVESEMVGICEFHLHIPSVGSLKEKRRIIKGLKDRIRNRFNVSIAELDDLDKWQSAVIGVACISNDRIRIDQVLSSVARLMESTPDLFLIDYSTEIL